MEHTLELSTDCQNHSKEGQPYVAMLSVSTITHTLDFILICTLFRCINVLYGQKLCMSLFKQGADVECAGKVWISRKVGEGS